MSEKKVYVGGSKGGVGKSKLSFAVIDYMLTGGKKMLLLETDTSNPDVMKAHKKIENEDMICKRVDLDSSDGWIEAVNFADEFKDHVVVINSAARSNTGIEKHGATLRETLGELDRKLYTLWIINRQRDSIELLRSFMHAFPDTAVHIFRNLYFGAPEKFELYNNSNTRKNVEKNGSTVDFPDLADRVADRVYSSRIPIQVAMKELPIGDRAELKRWTAEVKKILDSVFTGNTQG